jgi:hypothetical protein
LRAGKNEGCSGMPSRASCTEGGPWESMLLKSCSRVAIHWDMDLALVCTRVAVIIQRELPCCAWIIITFLSHRQTRTDLSCGSALSGYLPICSAYEYCRVIYTTRGLVEEPNYLWTNAARAVFNILPQFLRDCVKKSTGSTQRSCYRPNSCFSLGRRA